ncbi:MAG: hypothetical protein AAGG72_03910 [Pseudomonadota bacterium]
MSTEQSGSRSELSWVRPLLVSVVLGPIAGWLGFVVIFVVSALVKKGDFPIGLVQAGEGLIAFLIMFLVGIPFAFIWAGPTPIIGGIALSLMEARGWQPTAIAIAAGALGYGLAVVWLSLIEGVPHRAQDQVVLLTLSLIGAFAAVVCALCSNALKRRQWVA